MLVYALAPGKTEVRVRFPEGAQWPEFRSFVLAEIDKALQTFMRKPA